MAQPPIFKEIDATQFSRYWLDVAYADQSPYQTMDIWLPDEGDGPFPVIVFVHGGGWIADGKRVNTMPGIFKFMSQGYAMVSVEYRIAPQHHWPAPLLDVRAAIRFLRAHAEEFQLKTDKIALMGNSAGAHLSNMVAALAGRSIMKGEELGNADIDDSVQCLVSLFAPTDLYKIDFDDWSGIGVNAEPGKNIVVEADMFDPREKPHNLLLGYPARENREAASYASPVNFVNEDFPPAYYLHGIKDKIVPYTQSIAMWRRVNMECSGDRAKLELFPDADHGDPLMKTDENINKILDFVDMHLWDGVHERTVLPGDPKLCE